MTVTYYKAGTITAAVTVGYLLTYTGFDKPTWRWMPKQKLRQFFLCERGVKNTVMEANKVLGLTSLTLLAAAFIVPKSNPSTRGQLLDIAGTAAFVHGLYSALTYRAKWSQRPSAMIAGTAALALASVHYVAKASSPTSTAAVTTSTGLASLVAAGIDVAARHQGVLAVSVAALHFYLMERKAGSLTELVCRPAAYASLAVAAVAIALSVSQKA